LIKEQGIDLGDNFSHNLSRNRVKPSAYKNIRHKIIMEFNYD